MPIETIEFMGVKYPALQSKGFASKFAFPFAKEILVGTGFDIGCNRTEWSLPGSMPIDPAIEGCEYDAYNLPPLQVDYIFSSHCLEHLPNWVDAIDYWKTKLRAGGILFLYLPHMDQRYWRSWHNRKHIHTFQPDQIESYLQDREWENIFVSDGYDLNHSFYAIAEK